MCCALQDNQKILKGFRHRINYSGTGKTPCERKCSSQHCGCCANAEYNCHLHWCSALNAFAFRAGRGRIGAALAALTQQPDLPNPGALAGAGIIPGAVGGEALSTQVSSRFVLYLKCATEPWPASS